MLLPCQQTKKSIELFWRAHECPSRLNRVPGWIVFPLMVVFAITHLSFQLLRWAVTSS